MTHALKVAYCDLGQAEADGDEVNAAAIRAHIEDLKQPRTPFRVVSISQNQNSFGLSGVIVVGTDGECWEIGHNQYLEPYKIGDTLKATGPVGARYFPGCEIPRQRERAPLNVQIEVWADDFGDDLQK